MIRTGCVVSLSNNLAQVNLAQIRLDDLNCSRCEKGEGCAIRLLPNKPEISAPASIQCANTANVTVGDHVEIHFDVSILNKLRVYSAYLLPIMGLLAGALAGTVVASQLSTDSQLLPSLGAIFGFVGGILAYPAYNCEQHATDLQGLNPRINRLLKGEATLTFRAKTSTDG